MNDEGRNEIIEKIRKIIAKSNNNPSEAESQVAILKAQEMLIKHGLSMKEINNEIAVCCEEVKEKSSGLLKSVWWHKSLALRLAENFKCMCYLSGNRLIFTGLESDIEVCVEIFNYAKKSINYNCNLFMIKKKNRLRNVTKEKLDNARKSYITGYLHGMSEKLRKQVEDNQWALMIVIPDSVQKHFSSKEFGKATTIKQFNYEDKVALREGYKAGKEFELIKWHIGP